MSRGLPPTTEYRCMSPEELRLWLDNSVNGAGGTPCVDCPAWFREEQRDLGRCVKERERRAPGRPLIERPDGFVFRPQAGVRYMFEEERIAARREAWRLSKARARVRAA